MTYPAELLQWYDGRVGERHDELVIAENKRFELVEKCPAPLDLTDTEILDFLGEYVDQIFYSRPTPNSVGGFRLYVYDQKTTGPTLRDAACLAAAKWKEANE